jgi:hypothetical protein
MPNPNGLMSFQNTSASSILGTPINQLPHIESKAYLAFDQ